MLSNKEALKLKREALKALRVAIKEEATIRKALRADAKAAKAAAKAVLSGPEMFAATLTPTNADTRLPTTRLRGCENSAMGAP